jgi:hypothetical protein
LSDDKFQILTNSGSPGRKIGTCLQIMVNEVIKKENPKASFAFIGTPIIGQINKSGTKRFKLYQIVMRRFFNPANFLHHYHEAESTILIFNKKDEDKLAFTRAEQVFSVLSDLPKSPRNLFRLASYPG